MDTGETYIKMCDCEEIQEVMSKYEGHLEPPDDGIYHRVDPYPVAVIYDNTLRCPTCRAYLTTPFCPKDGARASTLGEYHLMFGGPCKKDLDECRIVWLPRQDQLQEMVGGLERGFINWRDWLSFIYGESYFQPYKRLMFQTYEQLWLAFVMKEKYNKTWNEDEWK